MIGQHIIDIGINKAIFNINGELVLVHKLEDFNKGESTEILLVPFITTKVSMDIFFHQNSDKSKKLIADNIEEASYQVFGEIVNIEPIVLNAGLVEIEIDIEDLDSEINYKNISLGDFVYFYIDRLDIEKH